MPDLPPVLHWHCHSDGVVRIYRAGQMILEIGPDDPVLSLAASLLEAAALRTRIIARG